MNLKTENSILKDLVTNLETNVKEYKDLSKDFLSSKPENAISYIKPKSEEQIRDERINELESVSIKSISQQEELGGLLVGKIRSKIAQGRNQANEDTAPKPKK